MTRTAERVKAAFEHKDQRPIVRGELWLGKGPFQELRIKDDLEGHLSLRNRLGMDLLFLPVLAPDFSFSGLDYRRFSVSEIEGAVKASDLFIAVIVDGPFQRLVEKHGLLPLLTHFKDEKQAIVKRFAAEAGAVESIVKQCLKLNVGAVVLADDLGYQGSTYISPHDSEKLLAPLYSSAVAEIHAWGAYALFHSCGNINALLPQLLACGFDGLAACQDQCLDLVSLKKIYGSKITFLAGMDADILEAESLNDTQKKEFGRRLKFLAQGGGFILSSSCGLYSRNSFKRLLELYAIAEEH